MSYTAKPVDPTVASASDTLVVEPSSSVHTNGFAVATRPPAQWFNWLFKRLREWVNYNNGNLVGYMVGKDYAYSETPKVAANGGGTAGLWTVVVAIPETCVFSTGTLYGGGATVLDLTHVTASGDKRTDGAGNYALHANTTYYVYMRIDSGAAAFRISRTVPVGLWMTGQEGVERFICTFQTDNQGTFSSAFPGNVGVPKPFVKNGRRVTFIFDASTTGALLLSSFTATTPTLIQLSDFVPPGTKRVRIHAITTSGTDRVLEVGESVVALANGQQFSTDRGIEFEVGLEHAVYFYALVQSSGTIGVSIVGYEENI